MGRTVSDASGCAPEDDEFDPRIDDFVSKERKYVHFDLPLSEERRTNISFTDQEICGHSFWPLLAYDSVERRAKKNEAGEIYFEEKSRPIKFASHLDAAIFEWYGKRLSEIYESRINRELFASSILAYRANIGDNIAHAKSLFDEIASRGECIAIAVDVSGFFDHIRHDVLAATLREVLGVSRLSNMDYKIFERMTRFSWVDSNAIQARLGSRYGRRGRICSATEFRNLVRPKQASLVQENSECFGIPQGTPLSGLYANISMLGADEELQSRLAAFGGSYRRYSDDIAVVLPTSVDPQEGVTIIEKVLKGIGLELSVHKTEISKFLIADGALTADKPFQYLGFTFDGQRKLIRQSSLNRYYSKMHSGIRAKVRAAKNGGVPSEEIYLRELYRRYTHFGRARNFPRYAYRAARILEAPEIQRQLRNHMTTFRRALRYYLDRAYS
ncbi:MAG: hypothetical protein KDE15_05965 [Erythrobacter sp.]|nr:hypothetical protein [Erythrobacter sp.]